MLKKEEKARRPFVEKSNEGVEEKKSSKKEEKAIQERRKETQSTA